MSEQPLTSEPLQRRHFSEGFPELLPRDRRSTFQNWSDAINDSFLEYYYPLIDETIDSHFVDEADGWALDRIGDRFGPLGDRRKRGNDEYRQWLKAIKRAFSGTGTVGDIRLAVSSTVRTDIEDIELTEYFAEEGYRLVLWDWEDHTATSIPKICSIAGASGLPLLDPANGVGVTPATVPIPDRGPVTCAFQPGEAKARHGPGLGFGTIRKFEPAPAEPDVHDLQHGERTSGLGDFRFGERTPLSEQGTGYGLNYGRSYGERQATGYGENYGRGYGESS